MVFFYCCRLFHANNFFVLYLLLLILLLLLLFSYLIAVSSKLFLSPPMILAFCAANWRGGGASGGMVLIGMLNCRTPFLNHDTSLKYIHSHARKFTVCMGMKEGVVLNKNSTVKRPFQLNSCAIVYKL